MGIIPNKNGSYRWLDKSLKDYKKLKIGANNLVREMESLIKQQKRDLFKVTQQVVPSSDQSKTTTI
jgi:Txe/YoeB family toxin of Txe-Axe toxin-antitoxin module